MKKTTFAVTSMMIFLTAVSPISAVVSTVKYTEDSSWTVTIPDKIEIDKDTVTMKEITATDMNIAYDHQLRVKVTEGLTDSKVTLKRSDDTSIDVLVSTDADGKSKITLNSTNVAVFADQSTTALPAGTGGKLYFEPVSRQNTNVAAGSYTGTMTFQLGVYKLPATGS